ncbi:hypothetical protein CF54_31010 [Streptomyces sp. Tu 6176]|uniref:hypothetical protein n=1 Tax=Streptomyces sp. Tu 6176 TaxID=1470557 RepID=UPI0004488FEA|nr:hypothetical protein [Streptomyces sp. Tu 6176]EYT79488.1 hypothetical protein CF54_31010 [Streptomyces sp. Tu 6176]
MWKRRKCTGDARGAGDGRGRWRTRHAGPVAPELCDLCGLTFPACEAVRERVPDSSAVHPTDDWFDGLRLVTACSEAHLAVVRERYRHRPFVQEELWAAKIERALSGGTQVLTMERLGCRTGLHAPEIRRAIAWHNAHLPPDPPPGA